MAGNAGTNCLKISKVVSIAIACKSKFCFGGISVGLHSKSNTGYSKLCSERLDTAKSWLVLFRDL